MYNVVGRIKALITQNLPTGRAFRVINDSTNDQIITGISEVFSTARNDLFSLLDIILPDNDNFTENDALRWESLLGMVVNPDTSLSDRKLAILRKMSHPGNILARQSRDYIESQLQAAGFDVYVYENLNDLTPQDVFGASLSGIAEHSADIEHGDIEHGGSYLWPDIIANRIDWQKDQYFDLSFGLETTFYICGSTLGDFAEIPEIRREEFRQTVLKLKPLRTVAFIGITYT